MSKSPLRQRRLSVASDWSEEIDTSDEKGATGEREISSSKARAPSTPVRRVVRSRHATKSPVIRSPKSARQGSTPRGIRQERSLHSNKSQPVQKRPLVSSGLTLASSVLINLVRITHTILAPVYHYVFLIAIALLALSTTFYALWTYLPPLLFSAPGYVIRHLLSSSSLSDIDIGQKAVIYPLRTLATPLCALTGQACTLSLLSTFSPNATEARARPFWKWGGAGTPNINMGEVARSLTKEVKGAKDIFESLELLSNGEMWNRLEHLRIWELATAIQVGSRLDEREMVASGLRELGHTVEDLSYEMVETNALAGVSFQWLVWEFESLVKDISAPPAARPPPQVLSKRLNSVLTRLSSNMDKLHELASRAYTVAQRGSIQGQQLHTNLNLIVADLKEAHESAPGWKLMADKANRFFVGGELSKVERIAKDLVITDHAFTSLSSSVRDLEKTRLGIKEFKDQIGYFDTNLMGFHLGAGEHVGLGPEDEVRILAQVVEDFGTSIGRVKAKSRREEVPQIEP